MVIRDWDDFFEIVPADDLDGPDGSEGDDGPIHWQVRVGRQEGEAAEAVAVAREPLRRFVAQAKSMIEGERASASELIAEASESGGQPFHLRIELGGKDGFIAIARLGAHTAQLSLVWHQLGHLAGYIATFVEGV